MADDETTTLQVTKKTRDKLASLGSKDDSFNVIIDRLVYFYERYKGVVEKETK